MNKMKRNGFSLVELMVVIAIIGTLIAIGGLTYSSLTRKTMIENQVKTMYSDLMAARSEALYRKTYRYVTVTAGQFSVYTSSVLRATPPSSGPIVQKTLKQPIASNNTDSIYFEPRGTANTTSADITATQKAICVAPNDPSRLTSIVISATSIQMGKINAGGECGSADFTPQ